MPIWQSWQVSPRSLAGESLYSLNASSSRKLVSVTSWHAPQKLGRVIGAKRRASAWTRRPRSPGSVTIAP